MQRKISQLYMEMELIDWGREAPGMEHPASWVFGTWMGEL